MTNSPIQAWKVRRGAIAATMAAALAFVPGAVSAQTGGKIAVVRDAETEALLYDYVRPLLKAADVSRPDIILVPSPAFNAFVTGRGNLFINTGALIDSETPNEIIGVLAHEIAHIANDDVAAMNQQIEDTKFAVFLASIIGVGAAVGGAMGGSSDMANVGAGVLSGAAQIGQRSLLRYQREKEAAADRNAVRYLNATGQSGAGMLATLERLADDNLLLSQGANPYLLSHPLPRERVQDLEHLIGQSQYVSRKDPPELQVRHDLVRAKLVGFTWTAQNVQRRYPLGDNSLAARYARAIVTFRTGTPAAAVDQVNALIKAAPNYPYFYELKGQVLMETGDPSGAVAPLRKAVSLAPNSGLLKIMLAQAIVATGNPGQAKEAIELLTTAMKGDPDVVAGYRALARAYAMVDNVPMAQLATAQGLFAQGNYGEARMQAERAQAKLKQGSPAWLRADDIVTYKPPKS